MERVLYIDDNLRVSQLSFCFFSRYFSFVNSNLHINGVTVIAIMRDIVRETKYAMPSGFSIRPSIPERKNSGTNDAIIINVALSMEARISTDALKTTSSNSLRSVSESII